MYCLRVFLSLFVCVAIFIGGMAVTIWAGLNLHPAPLIVLTLIAAFWNSRYDGWAQDTIGGCISGGLLACSFMASAIAVVVFAVRS